MTAAAAAAAAAVFTFSNTKPSKTSMTYVTTTKNLSPRRTNRRPVHFTTLNMIIRLTCAEEIVRPVTFFFRCHCVFSLFGYPLFVFFPVGAQTGQPVVP